MVEQVLNEYAPAIIMIMGLVRFTGNCIENGITRNMVLQFCFCIFAGILLGTKGWEAGFTATLLILIVAKFGMLLSLTTLFWDFFLKKIKAIGNGKKI